MIDPETYNAIHSGTPAFFEMERGLIAVRGKEAVQFLNGMITNDVAKLEDGAQMTAAFPNAQGRLVALVRVKRDGERFLFETEGVTREKVFNNLFRFTFAGDFFVEDLSEKYVFFRGFGDLDTTGFETIEFEKNGGNDHFVLIEQGLEFKQSLSESGAFAIGDDLYELLRIGHGIPLYGKDMDEGTVVLETGIDEAVSFNKGCYIGQEIIARIHFRGHVAKRLSGLVLETTELPPTSSDGKEIYELFSEEGKNAGRLTSTVLSPQTGKIIALGYVRYDYLAEGTKLKLGDIECEVTKLPFFPVDI